MNFGRRQAARGTFVKMHSDVGCFGRCVSHGNRAVESDAGFHNAAELHEQRACKAAIAACTW